MRAFSRFSFVALLTLAAACNDERRDATPTAPIEISPDGLSAYIVVSNPGAPIDTEVTVTVRSLRGRNVGPIGSYTIRLGYDSLGLAFGKAASSSEGMVLANAAKKGVVVAAGASADGFKSDDLLSTTFTVTKSGGLKSLSLSVTELNSLKFEDQRANLSIMRGIYRPAER